MPTKKREWYPYASFHFMDYTFLMKDDTLIKNVITYVVYSGNIKNPSKEN